MDEKRRGLRFLFSAPAEVAPENSPSGGIAARIVEVSPHGCYVETPAPFSVQTQVVLKIFNSHEYFEAKATVVHVKKSGNGRAAAIVCGGGFDAMTADGDIAPRKGVRSDGIRGQQGAAGSRVFECRNCHSMEPYRRRDDEPLNDA